MKMGVFGRILAKGERIEGILRGIGEKNREKSEFECNRSQVFTVL